MSLQITDNPDGSITVSLKCPCCHGVHTQVVDKECSRLSIPCDHGHTHIDVWLKEPAVNPTASKVEIPSLREFTPRLIKHEVTSVQPMDIPSARNFIRDSYKRFAETVNETSNLNAN